MGNEIISFYKNWVLEKIRCVVSIIQKEVCSIYDSKWGVQYLYAKQDVSYLHHIEIDTEKFASYSVGIKITFVETKAQKWKIQTVERNIEVYPVNED